MDGHKETLDAKLEAVAAALATLQGLEAQLAL
jgi:hypothetical protein